MLACLPACGQSGHRRQGRSCLPRLCHVRHFVGKLGKALDLRSHARAPAECRGKRTSYGSTSVRKSSASPCRARDPLAAHPQGGSRWGTRKQQQLDRRTRLAAESINAGAARVLETTVLWVNEYQLRVLPAQTGADFSRPTVLSNSQLDHSLRDHKHCLDHWSCVLGDPRTPNSTMCVFGKTNFHFQDDSSPSTQKRTDRQQRAHRDVRDSREQTGIFAIAESIQGYSRWPHTTACLLQRSCSSCGSSQLIQGPLLQSISCWYSPSPARTAARSAVMPTSWTHKAGQLRTWWIAW